jgi:hypothetical protein
MPHSLPDARTLRPLGWSLYVVAGMLILVPTAEMAAAVEWTFMPGNLQWRAGATGLLASSLVTPVFGLFLALTLAAAMGHRWAMRAFTIVAGAGALLLAALVLLFALDVLQFRHNIAPEIRRAYYFATGKALFNLGVASVVLGAICGGGWTLIRGELRTKRSRTKARTPAIVTAGATGTT